MVLPGHISGGYLATRAILAGVSFFHPELNAVLSATEINSLLVIGTLSGELPDIDLVRFYFDHKSGNPKVDDHRKYITHSPVFWLIISLVVALLGFAFSSAYIEILGALILGGSWSHLLFDSIEYGVPWLWPFSRKHFALNHHLPTDKVTANPGTLMAHWQFVRDMYLKTWTFWAEIIVTIIALIAFAMSF